MIRALLFVSMTGLLLSGCSDAPPAAYPRAPVIVISLDTVRRDYVEGFGAEAGKTPRLAQFGAQSIRFQSAIAPSHHTAPSHATMLSGFTPFVHGVALAEGERVFRIPDSIPLLAEVLKEAGYRTGAFTDGIQILPERGFDRGFDVFDVDYSHLDPKLPAIERFLDDCGDEPFLLFAHTYRAHQPYRAELDRLEEMLASYDGKFAATAREVAEFPFEKIRAHEEDALQRQANLTIALSARGWKKRKDLTFLKSLYAAAVEAADAECGRLLDMLRARGVLDRAIVVITSDHGEGFVEHRSCSAHMDLWDEILRVPLIVRLPDGRSAGTDVEEQVGLERLMPTLLELVGAETSVAPEGASFAPSLVAGEPLREEPVFSAMYVTGVAEPVMLTMRTRRFKRFETLVPLDDLPDRSRHLYPQSFFALSDDPEEQEDLAAPGQEDMARFARAVAKQQRAWARMRERLGIEGGILIDLDAEAIEAMKGVGYLGDK